MKKLAILTAGLFIAGFSASAMADVSVTDTIKKNVTKKVDELHDIDKEVYLNIQQIVKPTNSAEAQAVKNDTNQNNLVSEVPTTVSPPSNSAAPVETPAVTENKATINGASLNGSTGVIGVNQSPGNLNNQGNAASISWSEGSGNAFLHAESSASMVNGSLVPGPAETQTNNSVVHGVNTLYSKSAKKADTIDGSLTNVSGIVGVNQAAGHMNNQDNAVSLSVGTKSIAAISEADLGMVNANNVSFEIDGTKTDSLTAGALSAAHGIINVNQSSGSMNNQANVVAAAMIVFP